MIYLLTRLDSIKIFLEKGFSFNIILIFSILLFVVGLIMQLIFRSIAIEVSEKKRNDYMFLSVIAKKIYKYSLIAIIICFIMPIFMKGINALTPTSKEAAVIYVIPKVLNSEFIQKDVPEEAKELYNMSKEWLKSYIKSGDIVKDKDTLLKMVDGVPSHKIKNFISKYKKDKAVNKARIELGKAKIAKRIANNRSK